LGLDAGTQLSFELSEGEFKVRPIRKKTWADLWQMASSAPRPSKPVDIDAAIATMVRDRSDR